MNHLCLGQVMGIKIHGDLLGTEEGHLKRSNLGITVWEVVRR